MSNAEIEKLKEYCKKIRVDILKMANRSKSSHIASAMSCVDILVSLFFKQMNENDHFILSKGHGCMAYYSVLAEKGIIPEKWIETYSINGSKLPEHPSPHSIPGIDVGTGTLGHGLSVGVGICQAKKLLNESGREFVLLGDGECNEGSVWEAAMVASNLHLDNLVAIIDYNKMQAAGFCCESPILPKWHSFGWNAIQVDGHDIDSLITSYSSGWHSSKPLAVVANTIKGKGVSFMENVLEWHYRYPNDEELKLAVEEIQNA